MQRYTDALSYQPSRFSDADPPGEPHGAGSERARQELETLAVLREALVRPDDGELRVGGAVPAVEGEHLDHVLEPLVRNDSSRP